MARVTWHDDARLDADGVPFLVSAITLTTEAHLIIKSPELVRRHLDLLEAERPRRIVEFGVRDGGSADGVGLGESLYDAFGYLMADRQETPTEGMDGHRRPQSASSRA
jgi:hypothetical protein